MLNLNLTCSQLRLLSTVNLYFVFFFRDGIADISKAEFSHIFLQFHGLMYLAQGSAFCFLFLLKSNVVPMLCPMECRARMFDI